MNYAIEMGPGSMINIPSFKKIGSGIQKLIGGIHRQHGDLISPLLFFQNKVSRLNKDNNLFRYVSVISVTGKHI
jgi:hypothetical protein